MARADVFHKMSHNLVDKKDKITRIFEDMDNPESRGVLCQLWSSGLTVPDLLASSVFELSR
jgi:hypothetical protein